MRFQVNDIVTSGPGWRPGVYVITAIDITRTKNHYDGVSLVNGKKYRLGDDSLAKKRIGVADQGWNTISDSADDSTLIDHNFIKGRQRAILELYANFDSPKEVENRKRWEKLASLKPGDTFQCRVNGKMDTMTFCHVTDRGYKYVFVADNGNGKRYKYPLSVVVV